MSTSSSQKTTLRRSWFLAIPLALVCFEASLAQEFSVLDTSTRIRLQRIEENSLPALKIILPGQSPSDPGILVLFPEHVTARGHGKFESQHLYFYRPDAPATRPVWHRNGQSLEYEMELQGGVRMIARATLEPDGIRYRYDFINGSKVDYDMIQAVTDPRMISPYLHDVRLERTYVHHKDGFDLLASETPARLTMPLKDWLPNRYRASYTWPVEALRIEKKEDGLTWYNKSRSIDEPFLATQSTDGKWIFATFSYDPGNVWSNPELTCQHADPQTTLRAGAKSSLELKSILIHGTLEAVLAKVRQQRARMQAAPNPQ
jgi:hypothetical protein